MSKESKIVSLSLSLFQEHVKCKNHESLKDVFSTLESFPSFIAFDERQGREGFKKIWKQAVK